MRTVSQGFAAIEPAELIHIEEKWFGRTINGFARYLTYVAYLTIVVVALVAGLAGWNRTLRKAILQRTAALGDSERRFRQIAARLMHMQDDERRRIARMLHETTAQDLAALKMQLSGLQRTATALTDAERAALGESLALAEQSIAEIRTLSYLLHPPFLDEAGLRSALRWYATGFAQRSGITVDLELPDVFTRLPLDTETALFRIVQESLTNIHRHAGSVRARIRLQRDDRALVLEIEDQGRGIPPPLLAQITRGGAGVGVGIAGMRERIEQLGGRLDVASGERGTMVRASLTIAPLFGTGQRLPETLDR
jgi:signal transduction histidine kinase